MSSNRVTTLTLMLFLSVSAVSAQNTASSGASTPARAAAAQIDGGEPTYIRPETPEQRLARIASPEDPGPNPDENKIFYRFGKAHRVVRFERRWAVYNDPLCADAGAVRPFGGVNVCKELYQHNDKYVWVWMQEPEPQVAGQEPVEAPATSRYTDREMDYLGRFRNEFSAVTPAESNVTLRFEESSQGLPTSGSFRNSLAVADMNGDGHVDLIAPAERGAGPKLPVIYLGDGKGKWTPWEAAVWPYELDYGSVAAADFNKDGKTDLAFGVHLRGVYVFLGNGKGTFVDVTEGLPRDYPTRRIAAMDVDRDGFTDVVAISEGPTTVQDPKVMAYGRLRAFLNRKSGRSWEALDVATALHLVGGDFLAIGNFNADKYPDFAGSSIYFNGNDTLWLSDSKLTDGKQTWKSAATADGKIVPGLSYFYANTTGKFRRNVTNDDVVVSFVRFWPGDIDPRLIPTPESSSAAGLDFIAFDKNGAKRIPIIRWSSNTGVWGMDSGDFNGDRNRDVMFTRFAPRDVVLLLGSGDGTFRRAAVEGIQLKQNTNYDLKVQDVNGDARPDVIVMYETTSGNNAFAPRDGSIHVYLNRGAVVEAQAKK